MKVLYIYRNSCLGYSIGKVFHSIEREMKKTYDVESLYLPETGAMPWQLYRNIKAAVLKANSKDYDVIHITGSEHYLIPFLYKKHKTVITVHDLGFYTNTHKTIRTYLLYLLWIKTLSQAHKITCISEKTKHEVEHFVNFKPKQIETVMNPIDDSFVYSKHRLKKVPVILHIGTKENKNLEGTIFALRNFPHQLRIVGKLTEMQKKQLEFYHTDYSCVNNLTDEQLLQEYKNCDIVNFPSFYEGFGMPIIEGQAIGRPVVTSSISPMKEVAGNGAVLVDPASSESILQGYNEVMKRYDELVKRGRKNAERFSLDKIAQQYRKVYKELLHHCTYIPH